MSSDPSPPQQAQVTQDVDMGFVQSEDANRIKPYPSMSIKELWSCAGDCGVFSESPAHFKSVFDVLFHKHGTLFYRLLSKKKIAKLPKVDPNNVNVKAIFFEGVRFEDPYENFIVPEYDPKNPRGVYVVFTHDRKTKELYDVIEAYDSITFSKFKNIVASDEEILKFRNKKIGENTTPYDQDSSEEEEEVTEQVQDLQ